MELQTPEEEKEVEHKISFDEKGNIVFKKKSEIKKGKKSKEKGSQFELKVRKDLEEKGWIVDKWSNNIDLASREIASAKRKFNPFAKVMTIGTGFPDFIAFQKSGDNGKYDIIGVEVKVNGLLSKEEKEKCRAYLDKNVFREIWIAKEKKENNRVFVEYLEFGEIEKRMR